MAGLLKDRTSNREKVKQALEEIREASENGLVTAAAVVEAAADPEHSLHPYFEWDDSAAGQKYREIQARHLIREYKVEFIEDDRPSRRVAGYVSLLADRARGGGYRKTEDVLEDKDLRAELEKTFKVELDNMLNRYEVLRLLCDKIRSAAGIKKPKRPARNRRR